MPARQEPLNKALVDRLHSRAPHMTVHDDAYDVTVHCGAFQDSSLSNA